MKNSNLFRGALNPHPLQKHEPRPPPPTRQAAIQLHNPQHKPPKKLQTMVKVTLENIPLSLIMKLEKAAKEAGLTLHQYLAILLS